MTVTKALLVEKVNDKIGGSKKDASDLVESIFNIVKDSLNDGRNVKVSGFGHFKIREKRERRGRNPQTGDSMMISARRVVTFSPSQVLRNAVNTGIMPEPEASEPTPSF